MQSYIDSAVEHHQWGILRTIYDYKQLHESLFHACANGDVELLEQLLQDPHISVREGRNQCLISAIENDHINIVETLLRDGRAVPSPTGNGIRLDSQSRLLQALIKYNRPKMMTMLLPRLEPQYNYNWTIVTATQYRRYELLDLLMNDARVDPGYKNLALATAASHGYTDIVVRLLQSPLVDPSLHTVSLNYLPLGIAAAKGYDEIVDILLLDPRVNPAYNNNEALYLAARNNHLHIVKKLLQNNDVLTKGSLTHALGVTYSDGIIKLLRKAKTNRKKIRWERRLNLVKNAFRIH